MISRYALYNTADLQTRFNLIDGLPKGIKPSYNISPTAPAPVIISHEAHPVVRGMKWGLLAHGAKDTNSVFRYKTYNIVSENLFSRHSWAQAVRERRCLVPANGFYELDASSEKRAYYSRPKNGSFLAFAGVYSTWQDADGIAYNTYSILTVADTADTNRRIPISIKAEDEARWLDKTVTDTGSVYDMLRPHLSNPIARYEVSSLIYSPKSVGSSLIEPLQ